MKKLLLLLFLPVVAFGQPVNPIISGGTSTGGGGGSATNIGVSTSGGLLTTSTNGTGDFTIVLTPAVVGAVTSSNALYAVMATNAGASINATNVYYGGTVTTTNVMTKIASAARTNANAYMGFGGLQLSTAVYGQAATGNYNYRNGVEFLGAGWDGTPIDYSDLANHPSGFIHVLTNWGGSTGFNSLVLHIATPGAIRLEPNYGEPTFGVGYLTLGNEDGNAKVFVNDVNQSTTNGVDGNGYSQPLYFSTKGINGGTERTATPSIMGRWAGTNSGAGAYEGWYAAELSFMSRGPVADTDWPTYGRLFPSQTIEVARMRTNGWSFFGPTSHRTTNTIPLTTNVFLDFNLVGATTIDLLGFAGTSTNFFVVTNQNVYAGTTNFESRTFRIRSGALDRALRWPNWTFVSELGPVNPSTILPAQSVLYLRLESWGDGDTNITCQLKTGTDTAFAYDADAAAFFTAASISVDTQKGAVDYFVKATKALNLYTNFIAVYPLVGGSATPHSKNLINPATYAITWNGSITHNGNGITGDGSSGYGVIPLDWSTVTSGVGISNFHVAVYNRTTAPAGGGAFIGGRNGSSIGVGMTRESASLGVRGAMNTLGPNAIVNMSTDLRGTLVESRANDSAAFDMATRLGVVNTSSASTGVPTTNPYLLAYDYNGSASSYTDANLAFASVGYGFTSSQLTNIVTIVNNYEAILSRNAP